MAYVTMPFGRQPIVVHSTHVLAEVLVQGVDESWPQDPIFVGNGGSLRIATAWLECPLTDLYKGTGLAP